MERFECCLRNQGGLNERSARTPRPFPNPVDGCRTGGQFVRRGGHANERDDGVDGRPANSVPQDFNWAKAPAAYPAGAEIVVIEGDTTKPMPFTLRFRFPDGYALPPHQHPIDEHVTVIQGTFVVGMGTSGSRETAVEMPAGSFILIPALTKHYVFTKGVTITQVHGIGPSGIAYVNPADDPRK